MTRLQTRSIPCWVSESHSPTNSMSEFQPVALGTPATLSRMFAWWRTPRTPSYPNPHRRNLNAGKNLRPVRRDCDGVFEVRGRPSIECHHCPPILEHLHLLGSQIDHGLDRDHQPWLDLGPLGPLNPIQDRWFLMQRAPDAVSAKLPHDTEVIFYGQRLNRR